MLNDRQGTVASLESASSVVIRDTSSVAKRLEEGIIMQGGWQQDLLGCVMNTIREHFLVKDFTSSPLRSIS